MKNLKLVLAISSSLIISLFFLGVGIWANQANTDFSTALSQPGIPHTDIVAGTTDALAAIPQIALFFISAIGLIAFLFLAILVCFLPTIIAAKRKHPNQLPIFLVNLLLGPVFGLGWVIALVWACLKQNSPVAPAI